MMKKTILFVIGMLIGIIVMSAIVVLAGIFL